MEAEMTELRSELKELRDEMAEAGVHLATDAEECRPIADDDVAWVDAQAQINTWVSYFVIIYLSHLISSHLISSHLIIGIVALHGCLRGGKYICSHFCALPLTL